jgi:transcriptional regulator
MYTPRSFRVEDLEKLHAFIRQFSFGLVFSQADGVPVATHLPWMVDAKRGEHGTLVAHMARANPQWKSWTPQTELLIVFQGPHGYISPAWYKEDVTVPTWNYSAVHAYGKPKLITGLGELRSMVEALIDVHERPLNYPWDSSKKESVMEVELKGIIGFEIPIDRIEGKWKFNQNRIREDQEGVVRALEKSPHAEYRAVADIMRENLEKTK